MKTRIPHLFRLLAVALCLLLTGTAVACTTAPSDHPADSGNDSLPGTTPGEGETPTAGETPALTESETEPPLPTVSAAEMADALRADRWQSPLTASPESSLSHPSAIGINKETFAEVLYPAGDDSTYRTVVHVADYGITPENEDNSRAFDRMMNDLSDTVGKVKIVFPVGTYRFSSTLKISGRTRTTFCSDTPGTPFEILMTEWVPGIRISDSSDVQINDMTFDYALPSAIAGRIVSATTQSVVIRVDDAFDLSDPHYNGGSVKWGSYMEMKRDEVTGDYWPDYAGNLLYNSTGDRISNIASGSWNAGTHELTLNFLNTIKKPSEGTVVCVAYTMYENFGLYVENAKNVRLESISLYHTTGMAVGVSRCENVYLNRVFLFPRENSPLLMTATADGLHCISCTGEILVTNCIFEKSHDDCMNINSRYLSVTSASAGSLTVEQMVVPVKEGDVVEVWAKSDLHYVGSFTVKSVSGSVIKGDGITADMANSFAADTSVNPTLTVRNCFFGNKRNRGILVQVQHVTIENCTFKNIVHDAVQLLAVPSSFGEGITPRDVTIRNNKFITCEQSHVNVFSWAADGSKAPGVIRDVIIANNFFCDSGAVAVQISTGGNVTLEHNLFDANGRNAGTNRWNVGISISENVKVCENTMVNPLKRFTLVNEKEIARDKVSSDILVENNQELE